jgi:hypothetical protein
MEVHMHCRPVSVLVLLVLANGAAADAQPAKQPTPVQSIGGGAQWAYPIIEGGYLAASPGLTASWRRWMGPYLGIQGEFGWWRKTKSHDYQWEGYQTPMGFVSEPVVGSDTSRFNGYSFGVNILGRIPIGRSAIVAGGGPGLFHERGSFKSVFNGKRYSTTHAETHFGLQSLFTVEVAVNRRVSAFGGFRLEMRNVRWADSLVGYPTAGLRVAF